MHFFNRLRNFYEYGPSVNEEYINAHKEMVTKRRKRALERRRRRAATHAADVREAEGTISLTERYIFGVTGEDIVRNRRRQHRENLQDFYADHEDEIHIQSRYLLRNIPWYRTDDETIAGARRIAKRELYHNHYRRWAQQEGLIPDPDDIPTGDLRDDELDYLR